MTYQIAVLAGDGIGPEVMTEALRVLDRASKRFGFDASIDDIPCGGQYYLAHGRDWPVDAKQKCELADLILLGAVGWPAPDRPGPVMMADGRMAGWSAVLGNRQRLDLYANLRPVSLRPGVSHRIHGAFQPVWKEGLVDLLFVRENTEGLYVGLGESTVASNGEITATDLRVITSAASDRIILKAFEICERRDGAPRDQQKRVTCIAKHNMLRGCQLFVERFQAVGKRFPHIDQEVVLIDAFAPALVAEPERFDVCVTTNLFGDILTDLAAVLQGGLGMAVGCNIGDQHGMFEPIHGSAPNIAGKGIANPLAMVLAMSQGLLWLGENRSDDRLIAASNAIDGAVSTLLTRGGPLTVDMAPPQQARSTQEVGVALADLVDGW